MPRVRLLLLLTEKDNALEAIEKNMRQLTDAGCSELGQALAARFDDREGDYEQRLRAAEIAVRLLVIQKDRPRSDVQWALQLLPSLGGQLSSNRMDESIPSLYDCSGEEDGQRAARPTLRRPLTPSCWNAGRNSTAGSAC